MAPFKYVFEYVERVAKLLWAKVTHNIRENSPNPYFGCPWCSTLHTSTKNEKSIAWEIWRLGSGVHVKSLMIFGCWGSGRRRFEELSSFGTSGVPYIGNWASRLAYRLVTGVHENFDCGIKKICKFSIYHLLITVRLRACTLFSSGIERDWFKLGPNLLRRM